MTRPCCLFWCVAGALLAVHLAADPASEPFFYNDETRHVMTGVFVRDAICDLPASAADPKGYAVRYYAQYPALGIVTWPPFFYAVEGTAMAAFGTSYLMARVVLGLFALLAGWYAFRLVARTHGPRPAALVVALVALSPLVYEYSRRVMLEVPTLALVLAAVFHFERYLGEGRRRDALLACLLAALAALTRFDGVMLLPFFLLRLAVCGRWRLLARRPVLAGVALALVLTVPYYLFTWSVYGAGIRTTAGDGTRPEDTSFLDPQNLTFYPSCLPEQVGWPITVAAAVGLVAVLLGRSRPVGVYVGLAAATYATFTPLAELDSRHSIYWVPAVAVFAAEGVLWAASHARVVGVLAAAVLVGATAWDALARPAWWVAGYEDAARYVVEHTAGDRPVLMDGTLNGTFIYETRRTDPHRRLWVLRGDKVLYTMFSDPRSAYTEFAATEADVLTLLERYDPELIVVEEPQLYFHLRGPELLRTTLRKHPGLFRLEIGIPLRSNHVERFRGARLDVYRKLARNPHPAADVEIPVFGLGGGVRVTR